MKKIKRIISTAIGMIVLMTIFFYIGSFRERHIASQKIPVVRPAPPIVKPSKDTLVIIDTVYYPKDRVVIDTSKVLEYKNKLAELNKELNIYKVDVENAMIVIDSMKVLVAFSTPNVYSKLKIIDNKELTVQADISVLYNEIDSIYNINYLQKNNRESLQVKKNLLPLLGIGYGTRNNLLFTGGILNTRKKLGFVYQYKQDSQFRDNKEHFITIIKIL